MRKPILGAILGTTPRVDGKPISAQILGAFFCSAQGNPFLGPAHLEKCVGNFCCANFGGFCRGFCWRSLLGTFFPQKLEKIRRQNPRKNRRPKNKNPFCQKPTLVIPPGRCANSSTALISRESQGIWGNSRESGNFGKFGKLRGFRYYTRSSLIEAQEDSDTLEVGGGNCCSSGSDPPIGYLILGPMFLGATREP